MPALFSRPLLVTPEAEIGRDGDAMDAGRVRDFTAIWSLARSMTTTGPVRNVKALCGRIHGAVIPAAVATDGDFLEKW